MEQPKSTLGCSLDVSKTWPYIELFHLLSFDPSVNIESSFFFSFELLWVITNYCEKFEIRQNWKVRKSIFTKNLQVKHFSEFVNSLNTKTASSTFASPFQRVFSCIFDKTLCNIVLSKKPKTNWLKQST